jgi:HemY protein
MRWIRAPETGSAPNALPAVPNLRGWPPAFAERVAAAHASATSDPSNDEAIEEYARLLHANGFAREALACWDLLAEVGNRATQAARHYLAADVSSMLGEDAATLRHLEASMRLDPDYAPAWLRLAELRFKRGEVDAAERAYERRLEMVAGDPYATLGLARVAMQRERLADARRRLESVVSEHPEFAPARNAYAELLAELGDEAGAARERLAGRDAGRFREATDPRRDRLLEWCYDYDRLCVRGAIEMQTRQWEVARTLFERAVDLRPDVATGYEMLAGMFLEIDRPSDALAAYQQGLVRATAQPPSTRYRANLARVYVQLGRPLDGVNAARRGITELGADAELYNALGYALREAGEHGAAIEALQRAVELAPAEANAHYNLAEALLRERRLDEAVAALHGSLAARSTYPPALALLAQIEIDSGMWDDAMKRLQILYDANPDLPEARAKMALMRLRAGIDAEKAKDSAAAERHYRAGLEVEPEDADLAARLGALLLVQRRFAEAVAPLERYHRLRSDLPQSALFLGQAYVATGRVDDAKIVLAHGEKVATAAGDEEAARRFRDILLRLR